MKYIKVFASNKIDDLQKDVDIYNKQNAHCIVSQSSSVSMASWGIVYMLSVTYDDNEGEQT